MKEQNSSAGIFAERRRGGGAVAEHRGSLGGHSQQQLGDTAINETFGVWLVMLLLLASTCTLDCPGPLKIVRVHWLEEITYLIVIAGRAGERRRAGGGAGRTFVIRLVRGCSSRSLQPAIAAPRTN